MKRFFSYIHHLVIPSHRNNYRAKALHLDFLIALLALVSVFSWTTHSLEGSGVLGIAQDIRIERLYALTNEVRTSQGLPPLRYNDKLARAAENKAQHMFTHDYWAHFGAGKSPWDFILDSGYSYEVAGENLAKGFMYSESVVEGWKNSPTHYANLIRPEYDEVGFGVSNGVLQGEEVTLVVQMFGKQIAQAQPEPSTVAQTQPSETIQPDTQKVVASGVSTETPQKSLTTPSRETQGQFLSAPVLGDYVSAQALRINWTTFVIGFLLLVLLLDIYFAHKYKLIRITSKNVAHIIFLASLIIGIMVIKNGIIL